MEENRTTEQIGRLSQHMSVSTLKCYREKSRIDAPSIRNLIYGRDVTKLMSEIWNGLSRDPIFRRSTKELSLDEKRAVTFTRLKRVVEYNLLPHEAMLNNAALVTAYMLAVMTYDPSLVTSYQLHTAVSSTYGSTELRNQIALFALRTMDHSLATLD